MEKEKRTLEELAKEGFIPSGNWGNNCMILVCKDREEHLLYDPEKQEVAHKYSVTGRFKE